MIWVVSRGFFGDLMVSGGGFGVVILVVSRDCFGDLVVSGGGFGDLGGFERWFW